MSDYPPYAPPPGMWDALNDVDVAVDGRMYWAVLAYDETGEFAGAITAYDLEPEVAWAVVHSHNEALGLVQDRFGLYYRPDESVAHGGIYWRETVLEDFYA